MENSTYVSSNAFCQERVVLSSSFHIPLHGQWHANQVLRAADPQLQNMEKNVWSLLHLSSCKIFRKEPSPTLPAVSVATWKNFRTWDRMYEEFLEIQQQFHGLCLSKIIYKKNVLLTKTKGLNCTLSLQRNFQLCRVIKANVDTFLFYLILMALILLILHYLQILPQKFHLCLEKAMLTLSKYFSQKT